MKRNILSIALLLAAASGTGLAPLTAAPARADGGGGDAGIDFWVNTVSKTVTFAYVPVLNVLVTRPQADDDYWDRVDLEIDYANPKMQALVDKLSAQYPGYQLKRALMGVSGDFHLVIPSLGMDQTVAAMPGSTGPFIQWTSFVSKAKSPAFRAALAQPDAIQLTGNTAVTFPVNQVLEHAELGADVCAKVSASDVYGVIASFGSVAAQIDGQGLKYATTVDALKRSVLTSCLELASTAMVASFADLLAVPVSPSPAPARPVGETRGDVPTQSTVPLLMEQQLSINNGGVK